MDERPLDPGRVYLLKHTTRTVTAEVDHALALNQIGTVRSRPRGRSCSIATPTIATTGSFILIDPATNFTAGAGMIVRRARETPPRHGAIAPPSGSRGRRAAATEADAVEAVRRVLEEMLT